MLTHVLFRPSAVFLIFLSSIISAALAQAGSLFNPEFLGLRGEGYNCVTSSVEWWDTFIIHQIIKHNLNIEKRDTICFSKVFV